MRYPIRNLAIVAVTAGLTLSAQEPNPTRRPPADVLAQGDSAAPIFRIQVVERTTQAVNYLHRGGTTKIDFKGTALMPMSKGVAEVEAQRGVTHVTADLKGIAPASSFGPEYLTYVLWAISPDGRAVNLGELTLSDHGNGSDSKIQTASDIQTFGMIVTAEPYYGVTQPSDVVVLENLPRSDTRGVIESINAKYELLPRGSYTKGPGFVPLRVSKKDPLELYEAENALQLARVAGAEKYAADSFGKANDALAQAERYQHQHPGQQPVITMAREAVVRSEDARVIALRRENEEALANERQAAADRAAADKQKADQAQMEAAEQTRLRAQADADRQSAERAKAEALIAQQNAELAAANAARMKQEADQARQAAIDQQQLLAAEADKARAAAMDADRQRQEADRLRQKAEDDQAQLRQQLLAQFNAILQTRDTARGLIVNMSDVLFDTAQYSLKPGAREKLARVAGIIASHPGLRIEIEGHTDSVGGDEYNMKLSENRANAVRAYLVSQAIDPGVVTAKGFGKSIPVADNSTAAGRQMNRRVELVVSGEILGTSINGNQSSLAPSSGAPMQAPMR